MLFCCAVRWPFLLLLLITVSCASTDGMRAGKVLSAPPAPQESYQEKAQMLRLQKENIAWEAMINDLIGMVQNEDEKKSLSPSEARSHEELNEPEQRQMVDAYLADLKRIKILQQKLKSEDTALSREIFYLELINYYLKTLKYVESFRRNNYPDEQTIQKLKNEIVTRYQENNFYQVVDLYDQLVQIQSIKKINFTIKAYYALSLSRLEQVEDTQKLISELLSTDGSLNSENGPLWFALGEWLINNGQNQEAQEIFQKLNAFYMNEELWYGKVKGKAALFQSGPQNIKVKNKLDQARALFQEKGDFLGAYRLGLATQRECLDLACQSLVQDFLNQLTEQGKNQIDAHLLEINNYIKLSKYSEAQALMFSLKKSFPPGEYPFPIKEKFLLISQTEGQLGENKKGEVSYDYGNQLFERANLLLEGEKFEEAIVTYDELENTVYKKEAAEKKLLAIDGLARTRRLRAVQLVIQARNTSNVEQKKNYLIESYRLLKSVLDKYPNNNYAERIMKNLSDVQAEIEKIYPEFFTDESSQVGDKETGGSLS